MIGVFTFGDGSQPDKTLKSKSTVISKNSSSKLYECQVFFFDQQSHPPIQYEHFPVLIVGPFSNQRIRFSARNHGFIVWSRGNLLLLVGVFKPFSSPWQGQER